MSESTAAVSRLRLGARIAIIGTGISGLGAAHLLHPHHAITVYEKNAAAGGHSRTITVNTPQGPVGVDTGFIVYNERNYPLLTQLFSRLQVPVAKSDMSFGASIRGGWLEYGTQHLQNVLAQKRNLIRPCFWRMAADILRFNARARAYLTADASVTLGQCLRELKLGAWFRDYYLLAMGGAIWSTPLENMLQFPAATFVRFFENHGLLSLRDQPQWYTVRGGSREYVARLSAPFAAQIRLNCAAARVESSGRSVIVTDHQGAQDTYDAVVFACHADEALALIASPSAAEQAVLGAFAYQENLAVLHSDVRFMPRRRAAWASWVYLSDAPAHREASPGVSLSYWMNRLQPLPTTQPMIVTLNPARAPEPSLVHNAHRFTHPLFDAGAIRAQREIPAIQGVRGLWFCGAYQRYGFHEDGLGSAVAMVAAMGGPAWS